MTFITKDDIWGIRQSIRILWNKSLSSRVIDGVYYSDRSLDKQLAFDVFYNQQIPEVWRETLATVKRHTQDIVALVNSFTGVIWYKRNGQLNTANLYRAGYQFLDAIRKGEIILPAYLEIQEEQQKWQSHPKYNKERGFSSPIREELIQIRIYR